MSNSQTNVSSDSSVVSRQSNHRRSDQSHGPNRDIRLPGLMELENETIVWSDSFADQLLGVTGTCTGRPSREILGEGLSELLRIGRLQAGEPGTSIIVDSAVSRADGLVLPLSFRIWPCCRNRTTFYLISVMPGSEIPEAMELNRSSLLQWAQLHRRSVIGEIAASLVHELGQSLTSIQGIAEILNSVVTNAQSVSEQDARHAVSLLLSSSRRATGQLSQIWQFLKADQPSNSEVNLSEMLVECAAIVSASGRHEGTCIQVLPLASVSHWFTDQVILKTMLVRLMRYCMTRNTAVTPVDDHLIVSLVQNENGAIVELRKAALKSDTGTAESSGPPFSSAAQMTAGINPPGDLLPADALSFCTAAARFLGMELLVIRYHRTGELEACLRIPKVLLNH